MRIIFISLENNRKISLKSIIYKKKSLDLIDISNKINYFWSSNIKIPNKEYFNDTPWSPEGKSLFEEINPKERQPKKEAMLLSHQNFK